MNEFAFIRPTSLAEAVEALKGDEHKALGGGQSLIPILKLGLAQPRALVSLTDVPELRGIKRDGDELVIGAASTHAEVASAAVVRESIGALAKLAETIGDAQVRNRGTLGGSIAHSDPAADYPAAVLALDAKIVTDRRVIGADQFFKGMFETELAADELITTVRFRVPKAAAYAKMYNPASRFAIVGVFVARHADGAVRVGVTGAAATPFRAAAIEQALAKKLAPESLDGIRIPEDDLVSDLHAGPAYRAHLVGVMARRAVAALA